MKIKCVGCNIAIINGNICHETGCHDVATFTDVRGKVFIKYRVFSLDVLGNVRDGFEVNDRSERGALMVPENATDNQIIRALKEKNLLNKKCRFSSFIIDGDAQKLCVDARKSGEPLYQLEAA